jgi:hypothetical protein
MTNHGLTEEDTRARDRWRNLVLGEGKHLRWWWWYPIYFGDVSAPLAAALLARSLIRPCTWCNEHVCNVCVHWRVHVSNLIRGFPHTL